MENNLTKEEIVLIKRSFDRINEVTDKLGENFYLKLFQSNPDMARMFKGDMIEQSRALMRMVKTVVDGLNNPHIIFPAIQDLGSKHVDFGVMADHYKIFGECLISCMEELMHGDFDELTKAAWVKLYDSLAVVMKGKHYD